MQRKEGKEEKRKKGESKSGRGVQGGNLELVSTTSIERMHWKDFTVLWSHT